MIFSRAHNALAFALLVSCALGLKASSSAEARLSGDYASYSFFDEGSYGLKGEFSWSEDKSWGARGSVLGLKKYGIGTFQGAIGATYFILPIWKVDFDFDAATVASILPRFSITTGTSVTISEAVTPGFSYNYAHYEDAHIHTLTPSFSWSIVPQVSLTGKLNGALSRFVNGMTAGNISGAVQIGFAPFDYFSMSLAYSVGEQPFDPGEPDMPLSSYFAHTLCGGFKFDMDGHLGAQVSVEQEWRNNSQRVLSAQLATYYRW